MKRFFPDSNLKIPPVIRKFRTTEAIGKNDIRSWYQRKALQTSWSIFFGFELATSCDSNLRQTRDRTCDTKII